MMPKFAIESKYDLMPSLQGMGIKHLFSDDADLSAINGLHDLRIAEVKHAARIDVNEYGTEFAPKEDPNPSLESGDCDGSEKTVTFRADHPILFVLRDSSTATVLSLGVVQSR